MAKKTKKIESSDVSDITPISTAQSTQEPVGAETVVESPIVESVVETPLEPAVEVVKEEIKPEYTVPPITVETAEVFRAETQPAQTIQTRKIGKITVNQAFLNSNTMFFPWLHRQGYAIQDRHIDTKRDKIEFVLTGGDMAAVPDGIIPDYNVQVTGNRLVITKI